MLMRDVDNLRGFFGQHAPELRDTRHGPEMSPTAILEPLGDRHIGASR
jgi:serine/threonine-protein kinase RIO1